MRDLLVLLLLIGWTYADFYNLRQAKRTSERNIRVHAVMRTSNVTKENAEPRHRPALMAQMAPPLNTAQLQGTHFVTVFINSHISASDTSYTENLAFIITNVNTAAANVQISSPYVNFTNFNVSVPAGVSQVVPITPADIQVDYMDQYVGYAVRESKSIWINSDLPISIVASNSHSDGGSEDKYDVYPTCMLGTEYHAVGDESFRTTLRLKSTNIISVVALEDDTWVDLTAIVTNGNITINKGQTITVVTRWFTTDIVFQSGKNVAAVTGSVCGFGYRSQDTCSFEAVMMFPDSSWGKDGYYYKFPPQPLGEVMVLVKNNQTVVSFDGVPAKPIDYDSFWIVNSQHGMAISSDQPIYAVATGSSDDNGMGAPFFAHVPATENFVTDPVQFLVAINDDEAKNMKHFVRIVTNMDTIGKIALDSYTPSGLLYTRMGKSNEYFYDVPASPGTHTVTPQAGVAYSATVYGYGYRREYAFTPALAIPRINMPCGVEGFSDDALDSKRRNVLRSGC